MRYLRFFKLLALSGLLAGPVMGEQLRPEARDLDPVDVILASVSTSLPEAAPPARALPEIVAPALPLIGPETNLPMPRYVSLKASEGNLRRGPSLSHRIDWVLLQRGMPLRVTNEYGHWRRVSDRDGISGWVHHSLISGVRTVIVQTPMLTLLTAPQSDAREVARLEANVIARLYDCTLDWCEISADGYDGWAPKAALWGVEADELRD